MTVGEHIKAARKAAGLSQVQLADLSGISINSIISLEQNKHGPSVTTAELLADALEISIDELVGHEVVKREKTMW